MSVLLRYPQLRWLVPVGITLAIVGGGAMVTTVTASADPTLPPRDAAQLLVDLQQSRLDGVSGTVVTRSDLGLPQMPSMGKSGPLSLTTLASGDHTLRVWYSGPHKARIALMDTMGESDIIINSKDMWIWDSMQKKASHMVLPEDKPGERGKVPHNLMPSTPQDAANLALTMIDPTTVVSTAGSARVAGRSAYELVLAPRDAASLIGQVRIAIDAEKYIPVRTQVYAKASQSPIVDVAFTQISFTRPDDAQFRFNPPAGTKVEDVAFPAIPQSAPARSSRTTIGTGWTSVLVTHSRDLLALSPMGQESGRNPGRHNPSSEDMSIEDFLAKLPKVSGSWGSGRMITSKAFSALITDDGRILIGAVTPEHLLHVASDPAASIKATS